MSDVFDVITDLLPVWMATILTDHVIMFYSLQFNFLGCLSQSAELFMHTSFSWTFY